MLRAQSRTRFEPPFHKIIICFFSKTLCACTRFLKGRRVQTGAGVLRNISQSICEKGVQKIKHAFCHTRVLQTRCAQSRTRFEPPFHKTIHVSLKKLFLLKYRKGELSPGPLKAKWIYQFLSFLRCSSFPRKRESSSRKAGLFTSTCFRLKSCFRFTLSRVRILSRVAIPSPVGGFGLVETLVVAGVSLTLGYGIIKTSLVGMQTNAIVHTSLKEQDLIHTVRTTLGDETQCKYNLKPSELTTAGTPLKTTVSEIKNSGATTATTDDISLIKAGENFKNNPLIHIQQMELSGTGSDRTFILYYKKPQLGSLSSPGTCTDLDPSGCYFIACKMDYDCSTDDDCSPTGSGVCNPRNCATGGAVAGVDTAQVTAIITEQLKKKNCSDDSGTTKVLKGFKETTGQLDIDCEPLPAQQQIQGCESGEVLQGFRDNGDPICVKHCSGGRRLYERWETLNEVDDSLRSYYHYYLIGSSPPDLYPVEYVIKKNRYCRCHSDEQIFYNGQCISSSSCEGNAKRDLSNGQCMTCSGGGAYWSLRAKWRGSYYVCECPTGLKKKKVA